MSLPLSPISMAAVAVMAVAVGLAWSRRFYAVGALVIANVVVFGLELLGSRDLPWPNDSPTSIFTQLSLNTATFGDHPALGVLQLFTSMFLHGGVMHLFGNILVLLWFALPFEERVGARAFTVIYVVSGFLASIVQGVATYPFDGPQLGASGAVAGIIGAFAASYPNLIVPLPIFVVPIVVRVRVWIAALAFTALQFTLLTIEGASAHVGYYAHLGGLLFGAAFGLGLARAGALGKRKPVSVDLKRLAPFARDAGSRNALDRMASYQAEPQVFQAWLERFLRSATCPTCSHKVIPQRDGQMVCAQGHKFDVKSQGPVSTPSSAAKTA